MKTNLNTIASLITLFILASCASTNLPPIGAVQPFQPESDEQQAWQDSKRIETEIEKRGFLYKDAELEQYLNSIAGKLVDRSAKDAGVEPRVRVILNPFLNAFALPDGAIYIHTGMLARMENEAQLVTVLGHELTHFTHRHAIKEMRVFRNRTAYADALQILVAVAVGPEGMAGLSGGPGQLWALASVRGYSRELETEADVEGIRVMVQNGYEPREALRVFQELQEELDERKVKEPFAFGTHPMLQERINNYDRLISTEYAGKIREPGRLINAEAFLKLTEDLLLENAALDLRIGRTGTARAAIEKHLKRKPGTARAHFLLGEIYRRSAAPQAAITAYQEAVRLDPANADALRELGLICRAEGRMQEARKAFTRYLETSPKAPDAPIIKQYIAELTK
jgi:predicted Zn-dependent protease